MNRTSLVLTAIIVACAFSTDASSQFLAAINTSVPKEHIAAITRDVAQWHNESQPNCRFRKLVSVRAVSRDKDSTTEHWTVNACQDKTFTYQVLLFAESDGSITDMVSDVPEKEPRK